MATEDDLLATLLARPDVRALTDRLHAHDRATYRHSLRVARFALAFARADGFPPSQLEQTVVAAMLHDLGKLAVDPDLLEKPGPLAEGEKDEMRHHAAAAVPALASLEAFPDAHRIAPLHHEFQGGASYPRSGAQRRGEGRGGGRRRALEPWIERAGRILALADRYDALISRRSYKAPWPDEEVRSVLREEMPEVADLLDHLPPPGHAPR
ncbi:MAG: HD domain-containing protein [Planctomycetota bacterium]|nr:HD domain-containing protein [Planctomycetota bacterium]